MSVFPSIKKALFMTLTDIYSNLFIYLSLFHDKDPESSSASQSTEINTGQAGQMARIVTVVASELLLEFFFHFCRYSFSVMFFYLSDYTLVQLTVPFFAGLQ